MAVGVPANTNPPFNIDNIVEGIDATKTGLDAFKAQVETLRTKNQNNRLTGDEFELLRDAEVLYQNHRNLSEDDMAKVIRPVRRAQVEPTS